MVNASRAMRLLALFGKINDIFFADIRSQSGVNRVEFL
jgi:hypothetical protein